MSTDDRPELDRFGDPSEDVDEGSLLFDPTGGGDPEDEAFLPPEPPPPSKAPVWFMVAAAVVVTGFFVLQMSGGSDPVPSGPEEVVAPVLPELPPDTSNRAALTPVPSDSVAGPIESSVRIAVRAVGNGGSPLRDTIVRFTVEDGDGSLRTAEVATTGEGIALTFLDLPQTPGLTRVTAQLPGSGIPEATIRATALPGAPASIDIVGGNNQESEVVALLPERARIVVRDARGNAVPGARVTFRVGSGDGQTAGDRRTDQTGTASAIWRLGPEEGEQTLVAEAAGVDQSVTFRATATPAATMELDNSGRAETAPVTVRRNDFAMGVSHVCALDGGTLDCRGANDRGQAAPAGPFDLAALEAGASHTCGLSGTGVASCWGGNDEGQLGDGTRTDHAAPARVRTDLRFSMLAAGEKHTCGLAGGGVPFCWGENASGQIGDGTRNDQLVPRTVGEGLGFVEITAGSSHTCGRTASGNTFCWGANNRGQLGAGSSGLDQLTPNLVRRTVTGLVGGHEHTCGLADGEALCWGANTFGQLGDGTTEDRSLPTAVEGLPGRPRALAAGTMHACALLADGRAFCWGQNFAGQLGDGTTQNRVSPVQVAGGLSFAELYAAGAQTCGITTDDVEYCWGLNQSGQLGDGTRVNRSSPARVGG